MAGIEKGTVFGGRYVVQSQVGTGGMATVYRGIDNVLDRAVAVKVMLPQYANDPAFAQRFKQEAQAAAALQNPYIVAVYDWGRDEKTGTYYIVMEYLRGTDLKTGIRSHGALAPRKVAQIGAQVCSALSVAHAHDIIHRDIKPQNIMIQPNGDAKVMDFGIARAKNSHLTQTNSVLGTAHYVSPEQAQGKELGATSDLYSLGVVMYEAATGKLPFDGDDAVSVALKQVNEQPVPPSAVNPNVDDRLESIIMCCMSKDPRQRFQTADELRRVLNNYINGRELGMPLYSGAGAGPTTRLAGSPTATQLVRPGDSGRTGRAGAATAGTQRMARETDRIGGAQRMGQPAGRAAYGPGVGMNGATPGRGRDSTQRAGGPGKGAVIGIVVGVAVVAIVAIVLALTTCNGGGSGTAANNAGTTDASTSTTAEKVSVPNLAGYTQQEAKNKLTTEGLELGTVTEQQSSTVTTGKVISSNPTSGTEVAKGSKVNIIISSGADTVAIPDIRQKSEADAQAELTAQGLVGQHDATLDAYSADIAEGLVVTYSPANKQVAKNTTIKYGLSKGVDPSTLKTTVPSGLVGAYYTDAEAALAAVELGAYEVWDYNDTTAWGYVLSVNPNEGTGDLDKGTTVDIHISQGPQPVEIGAYYGWSAQSAQEALSALGLTSSVDRSSAAPDAGSVGQVYATDPKSGTQVNKGSSVIVYVYGDYVPPTPTTAVIPSDITSDVSGAVSSLYGLGFSSVSVVTIDGATVSSDQYGNYYVMGVDGAGTEVSLSTPITVRVSVKE